MINFCDNHVQYLSTHLSVHTPFSRFNVWLFISWEKLQSKTDWNINHLNQSHIIIRFLIWLKSDWGYSYSPNSLGHREYVKIGDCYLGEMEVRLRTKLLVELIEKQFSSKQWISELVKELY